MTLSRRLAWALTTTVSLSSAAAGCTPSGTGSTPRAVADSAPEMSQEAPPDEGEALADSTPDMSPPPAPRAVPRPPVTTRPMYVPHPTGPYRIRVVDQNHHDLPTFVSAGRTYVMGTVGSRYSIVVANPTSRRVEVVLSVDGLDAMDGQPANYAQKRGYILPPYGDTTVDGFRTSLDDVATFRFSSVADSYAGRLGQPRDVGVIGAAFFPERPAPIAVAPPLPTVVAPPRPIEPPRHARAGAGPTPAPAPAAPSKSAPLDDLASDSYSGAGSAGAPPAPRARPSPAADAPEGETNEARESVTRRPGLGTEFGEERVAPVQLTEFERASSNHPSQVIAIRYNDRAGLTALGIAMPQPYATAESDLRLRETADPFRANRFAQPPP